MRKRNWFWRLSVAIAVSGGVSNRLMGDAPTKATDAAANESQADVEPASDNAIDLSANELAELSLDELMAVDVTSVAGVKQSLFTTPAAIYVIRPEDIAGSGHLTLAETLRLVPGVHVARTSSNIWAVSTRGFNGRLANKQLVLVDGRVVYDPFFAGVLWDVQQPFMPDVEKIEVIRGPGATLWGNNAVNGVINVNSFSARDTQGLLLRGVAGIGDVNTTLNARYGGQLSEDAHYRVYGQFLDYDNQELLDGSSAQDNWDLTTGGFRFDFGRPGDLTLMVSGELYDTERLGSQRGTMTISPTGSGPSVPTEGLARGGHLITRLAQETEEQGWQLQFVLDRFDRKISQIQANATVLDLDWRSHFKPDSRNELVWGLGVRSFSYDTGLDPGAEFFFDPDKGEKTTFTAFVQDTYAVVPEQVFVMLGSKFEHNDYTGFEIQPSLRAWWTPNDRNTVWAGVSRTVRVPALSDTDAQAFTSIPGVPVLAFGNPDLDAEINWTYEIGYRTRLTSDLSLDTTAYYSRYTDLISNPSGPGGFIIPPTNEGKGETHGVEAALNWRATQDLDMTLGYAYGRQELSDRNYHFAPEMPEHMVHLGADYRLTRNLRLDGHAYYVDDWFDGASEVPEYLRLDLGVRWQFSEHCELAVWGQNLLDDRHVESSRGRDEIYGDATAIGRSAYVQLTVKY